MKIFQFAVILHPKEEAKKTGAKSKLIVPLETILAVDNSAATLLAARAIPTEYVEQLDQVEVVIRPL